jgi:hypothetical protein
MGALQLEDLTSTVAQLKDEVLFIENEILRYHKDMNQKVKIIYNKIDGKENNIYDDNVWINEYINYYHLNN